MVIGTGTSARGRLVPHPASLKSITIAGLLHYMDTLVA
jgi:hypothetical protein